MTDLSIIMQEVESSVKDPEVQQALLTTVFKGLQLPVMKQAIVEGMIRGFKFKDFLDKNVYAIPYSTGYSLMTSIDYARKVAHSSGLVGKSEPVFEMDEDKIVSCSITVKKRSEDGYIGDFSEKVYFSEYYKAGKNGYPSLWDTKPRTMIAKVAEMHALRMACPEKLSKIYVAEEIEKDAKETLAFDVAPHAEKLEMVTSLDELKKVWSSLPIEAKNMLEDRKEELKAKFGGATIAKVSKASAPAEKLATVQILSEEEEDSIA